MAENEVSTEEKKAESSAESPAKKGLDEDAFHNFLQGKRHLLVKDYFHAVESLADACELYVKHYGETAAECGEVYYHYGLALFRLFRQQAGILGDIVPGSEEDDDEEESEENNEEEEKSGSDENKENENADSNSNSNENEAEEQEDDEEDLVDEDEESKKDEEMEAESTTAAPEEANKEQPVKDSPLKSDISKDVARSSAGESSTPSEKVTIADADSSTPSTSDIAEPSNQACTSSEVDVNEAGPSTSQGKLKQEDISDLQLAWETLETAKSIFKRQNSQDAQLKVADILLILAEISMELENYASAVDDLDECLHARRHCLEPDDRSIAETYYQLALAYTYDSKVQPALENYEKSMDVIKLRIENLRKQTEVKQNSDGFDIDPQVEIDELEGLLPEIKAKMEDTQDMMPDAKKVVKEMAFQNAQEGSSGSSSSSKPVSNIGHLLKRKKPEDAEAVKLSDTKKIKLVNTENGNDSTSEVTTTENASPSKA